MDSASTDYICPTEVQFSSQTPPTLLLIKFATPTRNRTVFIPTPNPLQLFDDGLQLTGSTTRWELRECQVSALQELQDGSNVPLVGKTGYGNWEDICNEGLSCNATIWVDVSNVIMNKSSGRY